MTWVPSVLRRVQPSTTGAAKERRNDSWSLRLNGRGGIRTHGTLLTHTHFPGVRLKPLGHPSQHRPRATDVLSPLSPVRLPQKKSASSNGGAVTRFDSKLFHPEFKDSTAD